MRKCRAITAADVGKRYFAFLDKQWPVSEFIGRIFPADVGKLVCLVGDILQVENAQHGAMGWEEVPMPGTEDVSPSEGAPLLSLAGFIRNHQITATSRRVDTNPTAPDWTDADHWRVELRRPGRKMTVYFSMGYAHKGKPPEVADVLDCLASDSAGIEQARDFADWCAEYGYDTDSRKAHRTFKVCERQAARLHKFLSDDAYNQLLYRTERL